MSNGKYSRKSKGVATKTMILILAVMMIVGCTIGGTLAWLTAQSETVTNTFTVGDINISLAETTGTSYNFVPGDKLAKDPKVTVTGGSEDCYLFVRIKEENNTVLNQTTGEKVINWAIANGWTPVAGHDDYWYREVTSSNSDQVYTVLADGITTDTHDGSVSVSTLVTKDMVNTLNTDTPKIIITAAAVQKDNIADVTAAFAQLPTTFTA